MGRESERERESERPLISFLPHASACVDVFCRILLPSLPPPLPSSPFLAHPSSLFNSQLPICFFLLLSFLGEIGEDNNNIFLLIRLELNRKGKIDAIRVCI